MTPLVQLNEADLAFCKVLAGIRRMANRSRGSGNYFNLGASKNNDNEELGIIAEYAFCKNFNVFFDGTFAGKDRGYDCTLNKKRIDIKAVNDSSLNLVAYIKPENELIDIFVLMFVNGPITAIIGWAEKDEVVKEENIRDLGYGDRYFLDQAELCEWA